MGACCGCLKGAGGSSDRATEMTSKRSAAETKNLSISRKMSAPSITVDESNKLSGTGLALAGVTIEQDAAYWEWHISVPDGVDSSEVLFGVATPKDVAFYRALDAQEEDDSESNGTALMKSITVKDGDTVGVAVQQSDLPMVQFLLNGEPLHELAINRFRGSVHPSISLCGDSTCTLVFEESKFKEMSPHARFGPLIVARGII
mmetsp:Transcript_22330/g.31127  ORF Transcript_22330/g.31127 Transcript_22330/m.31127 type:complete len:203 (+) Transcript_22330:98-706(+)